MFHRLSFAAAALCCVFALSCKKTVISDKVEPVATSAPIDRGIGDGKSDSKAKLRLTNARCDAERKTTMAVKVAGLKNTDWVELNCETTGREIEIDTKTGYCNVLQLKGTVTFEKKGLQSENYIRTTSNSADKDFFKVENLSQASNTTKGMNIQFEDTNDLYWKNAYQYCLKNENAVLTMEPITGIKNQPCKNVLNSYQNASGTTITPAIDWNDFEFTVESESVQFAVEGFSDVGCSSN